MDNCLLYWLIMVLVIICLEFTKEGEAVSTIQGSIVQLKCPLRTGATNRITWIKRVNDSPLVYFDGIQLNPMLPHPLKSRLKLTGNHIIGEYNLNISNVNKSDEGTYDCTLSGSPNSGVAFEITVITTIPTKVRIENVGSDKKLNGIEGSDLKIRCSAVGGDPAPDVKLLISESAVTVAKQSVQYTLLIVNRSYDRQNVKCLAGYDEIPFYPLNDSARIYLKLKPYLPTFSSDSVNTEETKQLVISCTSAGSRPMASIYWLLGNGRTNVTNNATQSSHSHDSTADTYNVTSTLTYSLNRTYNGKNLICGASNQATSEHGGDVETSKTLNISYAPDISVNSPTFTQDDATRTVTCNPRGNPDSYTYHKWQHKSSYGDLIREFAGNKTLKLPDVPVVLRYQDSGEYVCTASNGIEDKYKEFEQTGSGLVTVNAQPVFTSDTIYRVKQFGEIDKTVDIYVNVYSVPKFTSYIWARDGTQIRTQNSAKYKSSSSPTIVKDKVHGKEVQLDGYNVTLTIRDLKADDFVNYTVTLNSGFHVVKLTIVLESASVPETPGNFSTVASSATSLTVQWDPNSGGGYKQTFYIQYRVQGSPEWTTVKSGEEDTNEQRKRRTYEVKNLQEGKAYELRMFAKNTAMKRSNFTEVLISYTQSSAGPSVAAIIGGIAGGLTAIIIVLLVICFVQKKRKESGTPSMKLRASSEEEEDELKDNILYESSQSDGLKKNILYQSAGPNVESQKKSPTSCEYAVVQKPNAIYAEVSKVAQPKNGKEKKQKDKKEKPKKAREVKAKDKKEKPKKAREVKAKAVNDNPDDEYANSALQLKNLNNEEYANSTDTQGTAGHNTNAQGLEYADLTFRQKPTKNKKPVIHGNDERTIYADVDHTKKAPPPPQESEYEETNIKHGKMA